MDKKIYFTLVGIVFAVTTIILVNLHSKNIFFVDGVKFAVNLDDNSVNDFPAKGNYKVEVKCSNAVGKWHYNTWKMEIDFIKGDVTCSVDFHTQTQIVMLDDYIASLSGTTQGTGEVVNENGHRYEGKNPNNYIWFNDETWRVIGVFDTTLADGTTTERMTKIIKVDSIGAYTWDTGNVNDWNESTLKALLNTSYLNSENGTGTEKCYGYKSISTNCDYTSTGIKNVYKNMIENVTWNLGGFSSNDITASTAFTVERGRTVYSGQTSTGTGYIGLMYPSDYLYSSLESSCARTTTYSNYNSNACAGENWIHGEGFEWTMSPFAINSTNVYSLRYEEIDLYYYAETGYVVRPVVYLKSEVKYLDGAGSEADPLIVEM